MLISVITDKKNRLVKVIKDDLSQKTPEHLYDGHISTYDLSAKELAEFIPTLDQKSCLCLGLTERMKGLETPFPIKVNPGEDAVGRTKEYLGYAPGEPHWMIFDFDKSGLVPDEGFKRLCQIDPRFKEASWVVVPSSSSYIYDGDKELVGPGNYHIYVSMSIDDLDVARDYFENFFHRLMLNGSCEAVVTKAGSVVMRSLVDKSVWSPEREIFAANPIFSKESMRTKRNNHITFHEGSVVVVADDSLDLSAEEQMQLRLLQQEKRDEVQGEAKTQRIRYRRVRAERKAKMKGTSTDHELEMITNDGIEGYDNQGRPLYELASSEIIYNNDSELIAVSDILLNPASWDKQKLPDPHEPFTRGDEKRERVGRGVATVLVREDGSVFIYSHAHAGQIYLLRWDPGELCELLSDTSVSVDEKKRIWRRLTSDIQELTSSSSPAEIGELAEVFKAELGAVKGSGVGKEKRKIESRLKEKAQATEPEEKEQPMFLRYNAMYGVCEVSGRSAIIKEQYNSDLQTYEPVFMSPQALTTYHANERVLHRDLRGAVADLSAYKAWELHDRRNTYTSVVFRPSADKFRIPGKTQVIQQGGEYNLWQGYLADMSRATTCEKILYHLEHVWCGGDKRYYDYVIAWMAELFRHPEKKCGTALVLRSAQGAGKNIIIDNIIVKILGIHALSTANRDDFIGRFNKHMGWNVFTFANEAFWAGDKTDRSALKTLVTDQERQIEQKGYDKVKARSYTKLIFASNDQWVINLDIDDRRFVYLPVSNVKVGDKDYFKELMEEIENGGRESFLDYLMNVVDVELDLTKQPEGDISDLKIDDILQSAAPEVKFVNALVGENPEYELFSEDEEFNHLYLMLEDWRFGDGELIMKRTDLYKLFCKYCDICQMARKHTTMHSFFATLRQSGVYVEKKSITPHVENFIQLVGTRRRINGKPETVVVFRSFPASEHWIADAFKIKQRV